MNDKEIFAFWMLVAHYRWDRTKMNWREGQRLFNALHATVPLIAEMIRNTDCDPSYDDSKIPAFRDMIGAGQ